MGFQSRENKRAKAAAQVAAARAAESARHAWVRRYSDARAVACATMGVAYKPILAPRNADQLVLMHRSAHVQTHEEYMSRRRIPHSFEILTGAKGEA